jgi:cytochrome c-type biogenesis protein CcmH/NrfG
VRLKEIRLAFRSDDADLHLQLGSALAQLSRFKEAKTEFETVLRLHPDSMEAKEALAQIDAHNRSGNQ